MLSRTLQMPRPFRAIFDRAMMIKQTPVSRFAPTLALAVFALVLGYNWVVMKVGVATISPFTFAAARALVGAATLFAVMLVMRRPSAFEWSGMICVVGALILMTHPIRLRSNVGAPRTPAAIGS
jgi:hypothetical protein